VADFRGDAVHDDRRLLEELGHLLVAGLAVDAFHDVFFADRHQARCVTVARGCRGRRRRCRLRRSTAAERRQRRREARGGRTRRGGQLAHGAGDRIERRLPLGHGFLVALLQRLQLDVMVGIELLDVPAREVLQGPPVSAPLLDEVDDGVRHLELLEPPLVVRGPHERNLAGPVGRGEIDVRVDRHRVRLGGFRQLAELLLEARFLRAKSAGVSGTSSSFVAPSSTYVIVVVAQSRSRFGLPSSEKRLCRFPPRRGSCTNTGFMRLSTARRERRLAAASAMPCSAWHGV